VDGLMPLGRGVAYRIAAPELLALRRDLAGRFAPWLTGQDRERFRPHVTIQNKVTPQEARRTLERLEASFQPFTGRAEGLQIWHYRGGPWEPAGAVGFG
jgi:2'-5' RNA ligase